MPIGKPKFFKNRASRRDETFNKIVDDIQAISQGPITRKCAEKAALRLINFLRIILEHRSKER